LNDHNVSAGGRLKTEADLGSFVVGCALQKDGKISVSFWPVNIGPKRCAIAHFSFDAVFDGYSVWFDGPRKLRRNR
jgi:hypothetical protein